nr:MAG TPA: hypothetical protein [Caudoviricetes sp.]
MLLFLVISELSTLNYKKRDRASSLWRLKITYLIA